MYRFSLIFIISLLCTLSLNAQISSTAGETDTKEAREARLSKKAMERKLDVFNARRFKSFLFIDANYGVVGSFSRDETYTVSAPLALGVGYRFSPMWSVGLRAGQSIYNSDAHYYDRTYETRIQTRLQIASLSFNAHFPIGIRGEAYGGFSLGYQNTEITPLEEGPKDGSERTLVRPQQGLLYTGQLGVRYSLTPGFSIQSELTSGLSNFTVGLRVRLR